MRLHGRRDECERLGRLLAGVRGGHAAVLVLRGVAGMGKTALLDHAAGAAADLRVVRVAGVESETTIPFAALHQLCVPVLTGLDRLPARQRHALGVAFGLQAGPAPDRFLTGLAVLGLLTGAAAGAPLVCVIDNAQWLDRASRQALAFAARRLPAGPVLMLFATREPLADLCGLPDLEVTGLREPDARALLAAVPRWPLDDGVRDRILAEARGNPRALLAVPQAPPAAGLGLLDAQPLPIQAPPDQMLPDQVLPDPSLDSVSRELDALPAPSRLLLVIAAAEPAGDAALVWRAATRLGVPAAAAQPAVQTGLVAVGARVVFRHPLVRSAAYRSVPLPDRQRVHQALAQATDPRTDPDRRAWHLALAAPGPDEVLAAELEQAAGRALARGVLATAAAFGEHAAALTPEPARRTARALAGADAMAWAGVPDVTLKLLALAGSGPLDAFQQVRMDLVRAQLACTARRGGDAAPLLLAAAGRLGRHDLTLAHAAYLDAVHAAMFAGHLARPGGSVREVTLTARASWPAAEPPDPPGLLLDGLALRFGQSIKAGMPTLRRALTAVAGGGPADQELRWLRLAVPAALYTWDDQAWEALSGRYLRLVRAAGAFSELSLALSRHACLHLFRGELAAAAVLTEEVTAAAELTGGRLAPYAALGLAALRGHDDEVRALVEDTGRDVAAHGEGTGATAAAWASAVLGNGRGRYDAALTAARCAGEHEDVALAGWALPELIEAGARSGHADLARDGLRRLEEQTGAAGTNWALGVEARSRALLATGQDADSLYRDAIDRLAATRMQVDLARARLLYGEWLRRVNRRGEARGQLRDAYESLTRIGAGAFAERARRELAATGETVRKRTAETAAVLTPQESQIARLAGQQRTNPEIAAQLFISPRTVEYHLAKVFSKLEISSRRELPRALEKLR